MLYNILSQIFIVKCFTKSLLIRKLLISRVNSSKFLLMVISSCELVVPLRESRFLLKLTRAVF